MTPNAQWHQKVFSWDYGRLAATQTTAESSTQLSLAKMPPATFKGRRRMNLFITLQSESHWHFQKDCFKEEHEEILFPRNERRSFPQHWIVLLSGTGSPSAESTHMGNKLALGFQEMAGFLILTRTFTSRSDRETSRDKVAQFEVQQCSRLFEHTSSKCRNYSPKLDLSVFWLASTLWVVV